MSCFCCGMSLALEDSIVVGDGEMCETCFFGECDCEDPEDDAIDPDDEGDWM